MRYWSNCWNHGCRVSFKFQTFIFCKPISLSKHQVTTADAFVSSLFTSWKFSYSKLLFKFPWRSRNNILIARKLFSLRAYLGQFYSTSPLAPSIQTNHKSWSTKVSKAYFVGLLANIESSFLLSQNCTFISMIPYYYIIASYSEKLL